MIERRIMKFRNYFLVIFISLGIVSCDVLAPFVGGGIQPEATLIPNLEPTKTLVPEATQTPIPANPPTAIPSSPTPAPTTQKLTKTPTDKDLGVTEDLLTFDLQPGSPIWIHAWIHGCNWLGIAGQVFSTDGQPAKGLIVEAGGTLAGQSVLGLSITGSAGNYGPGGYEIQLRDKMVESTNSVWVQLKGSAGQSLSKKIYLDTADDCNQNLIVLNLIEVAPFRERIFYFPLVGK
jgi:hypothetical protein